MAQPRQILPTIGTEWDIGDPAKDGFTRKRFLQDLSDTIARPINNRVSAPTVPAAVILTGAPQSTGIGTGPMTPSKYAEAQIQARVTLSASAAGNHYVYVYRTVGNVPANGAPPNVGDIIVGSDAFGGGLLPVATNTPATLSIIDQGLSQTQAYKYYLVVMGPNGNTLTLQNGSQLTASEF